MQDYYWFIIFIISNSAILLAFTINVSRLRIKYKISWGDGGNKGLMKAIRVHANGTEQVPIYALIILSISFANPDNVALPILVIIFTLTRLLHAYGMLLRNPLLRQIGAAITYATQGAAILTLLVSLNA
ncbi:MAPEG family protein [Microbulbifer sp. TRSA007]|uniref:MAPEG family protein n=1 Tax=Microbulbifer sp. TRSA007 TaxID=3243384 RepID=UPI00403915EA